MSGVKLLNGTQLTTLVNVNEYANAKGFISYGFPLSVLKSIFNVTAGSTFTRTPGVVNNKMNESNSQNYNLSFSLKSKRSNDTDLDRVNNHTHIESTKSNGKI